MTCASCGVRRISNEAPCWSCKRGAQGAADRRAGGSCGSTTPLGPTLLGSLLGRPSPSLPPAVQAERERITVTVVYDPPGGEPQTLTLPIDAAWDLLDALAATLTNPSNP